MTRACRRVADGVSVSNYDRRTRDRYRQVVTGVTGIAGVGALTVTGGLMGMAAGEAAKTQRQQDAAQEAQPDGQRRADRREPGAGRRLRERPQVTRVTTRYVTGGTVSGASGDPGPGGSVSSGGPTSPQAPAPAPAPPPAAPPAPEPPPAPSSGS